MQQRLAQMTTKTTKANWRKFATTKGKMGAKAFPSVIPEAFPSVTIFADCEQLIICLAQYLLVGLRWMVDGNVYPTSSLILFGHTRGLPVGHPPVEMNLRKILQIRQFHKTLLRKIGTWWTWQLRQKAKKGHFGAIIPRVCCGGRWRSRDEGELLRQGEK